jgi:serine/threonine protein kinase
MNSEKSDKYIEDVLSSDKSAPQSKIDSDRYVIKKFLGRGTWGKVHSAYDTKTGVELAVKEYDPTETAKKQAEERGVTEESFMQSESLDPNAYRNVATRWLDFDKNGKPFTVTKKYDKFLSDVLLDDNLRVSRKNKNLSLDRIMKIGVDIASAIADLHTKRSKPKAHGDIKADNIGLDYSDGVETAELVDFGSATTVAFGLDNNKTGRKNSGFLYTRAPELFYYTAPEKEKSWVFNLNSIRPDEQTDVWSLSALITRMDRGKYPLEDLINNSDNPEKTISKISDKEYKKIIRESTKGMPYGLRKIVRKGLKHSSWDRYKNGKEMLHDLDEYKSKMENKYHALKDLWKWTKRLTLPVAAVSFFAYQSFVFEPKEITLPNITEGQVVTVGSLPAQGIVFEKEAKTVYAPDPEVMIGANIFNRMSDNAYVVHLMRQYRVSMDFSEPRSHGPSAYQVQLWLDTTLPDDRQFAEPLKPVAHAIEVAMNNNYIDGKIDLEDVCVESLIGPKRMNDAKRISGSQDYHSYKWAKYNNGTPVIKKNERSVVDTWLRNIELKEYSLPNTQKDSSNN